MLDFQVKQKMILDDHRFSERNQNTLVALPLLTHVLYFRDRELSRKKDNYCIEFPENMDPSKWFIGESNTPGIRKKRLDTLLDWIKSSKYSVYCSNS